jgi:membrane protein implicated in regulation of membrane protease activity
MDWSAATWWWVIGGVLVAAELATGTFYLLMLALGSAAAAAAAHAGAGGTTQVVTGALVGMLTTGGWYLYRARQPKSAPVESNRDANLDIGQTVQVANWAPDGSARVQYRGASWAVRFRGAGSPAPGAHVIVAVSGNELAVAPAAQS